MKYFYDTEFYEDGKTIDLISFGMVAEDGRELYLENIEFDWDRVPAGHWIWDNVYPHLTTDVGLHRSRKQIASDVRQFVTNGGTEFRNQLWGYFADYDHVVLAQLFGRMVDMPDGVPWFTFDIKQEFERLKEIYGPLELPRQSDTEHHALNDARWTKKAYEYLENIRDCN